MSDKVTQLVTDQIIKKLEEGVNPWRSSFIGGAGLGEHKNGTTGKHYRGINALVTGMSGYISPKWYTFKDIAAQDRKLKKGEKGTKVMLWKFIEDEKEETNKSKSFKRYYVIFNESQLEDFDPSSTLSNLSRSIDFSPIEEAEKIQKNWKACPKIVHSETRRSAFYNKNDDFINMPPREDFFSVEEYYSTLFHEMTHATGHSSRLKRDTLEKINCFGDHNYSKEELIAELGSAFLSAKAGISSEVIDNQASYIDGWLKTLKAQPHLIIHAAQKAQKAFDHILGVEWSK
jgi:antirestriction protein ArdC